MSKETAMGTNTLQSSTARREYWIGMTLTIGSAILWGSTYPAIQISLNYYNAFEISFFRAVYATLTVGLYFVITRRSLFFLPHDKNTLVLLLVASVLGAAGFWTLLNLSVLLLQADTSSFLVALYPLLAILLAAIFLQDKLTLPRGIGVVLGIVGTYLIIGYGEGSGLSGAQPVFGVLSALLASLSWAGYMVATKVLISKKDVKTGISLSPEYVTFTTFVIAIIPTLFVVLATSPISDLVRNQPLGIGLMLYLGVLTSGIAFLMFNRGMKFIGVSSSAINQLLFPAVAVVISYFFLGELIDIADILGMSLIVFGILVAQLFIGKRKQ